MSNNVDLVEVVFNLLEDISLELSNGTANADATEYHSLYYTDWFNKLQDWVNDPSLPFNDQDSEDVSELWYEAYISGLLDKA